MVVNGRDRQREAEGLRLVDLILLAIAAAFRPLGVISQNFVGITHPERLFVLIGVIWSLAAGISWGLIRSGVPRHTAVRSVFVAVVVLMSAGRILRQLGPTLGWLAVLSIMVLAVVAFSRLGDNGFVNPLVWGLAAALMSTANLLPTVYWPDG